jgi:hypothetical protein
MEDVYRWRNLYLPAKPVGVPWIVVISPANSPGGLSGRDSWRWQAGRISYPDVGGSNFSLRASHFETSTVARSR